MGRGGIFHHSQTHGEEESSHIVPHLLSPLDMGALFKLSHRVVLAPVTRCRAINSIPQPSHVKFYSQRTSKGGLLISEANAVSPQAFGFPHSPGIFSEEQVRAWRKVVDAVHDKGGIIFCQLWHVGRASHTAYQPGGAAPVSCTSNPISEEWKVLMADGTNVEYSHPRALSTSEIPEIVDQFRRAARNAMSAGFDGVEIHAAHGYLIDQFLKDGVNDRVDEYGGSVEKRCRFALQVVEAVVKEIGGERTAVRVSPIIEHMGATDSDPLSLARHLLPLLDRYPLAYLHVTEPRFTRHGLKQDSDDAQSMALTAKMWSIVRAEFGGRVMRSGGYSRQTAMDAVSTGAADFISFGRLFISNPDLPRRFAMEADLNMYDRSTFYTHDQVVGYTDYPFYSHSPSPSPTRAENSTHYNSDFSTLKV